MQKRGNIIKEKPTMLSVILLTEYHAKRCLPLRASDVDFVSDVHCVNDVVPSAQWANITSLRALARNIIMSVANNITFATANTSLTEKEQTYKIFVLRVCSFCRYKGLGLAPNAFDQSNAMLPLSGVVQILR